MPLYSTVHRPGVAFPFAVGVYALALGAGRCVHLGDAVIGVSQSTQLSRQKSVNLQGMRMVVRSMLVESSVNTESSTAPVSLL